MIPSEKCEHWIASELGPLGIDYLYAHDCIFPGREGHIAVSVILIVWILFLVRNLGSTASNYFSSTLASICERLKLPLDIAGVTLLAFGNGAPDVFSSVSSFTGDHTDIGVGIGALLGGITIY